jgi:hypothetical protein
VNVRIPRADDPREVGFGIAADDGARLAEAVPSLLEEAADSDWYERPGSDVDRAALALCRLRRAMAGQGGGPQAGDEAVRFALEQASPEALIWFTSRAISYMDENGFPDAVARWFPEDDPPPA